MCNMASQVAVLTLYLVACAQVLATHVRNGAYRDVEVTFTSDVATDDARAVVDVLKENLQKVSDLLHRAIGISIANVNFVLPRSLDLQTWGVDLGENGNVQTAEAADILVTNQKLGPYGKYPSTVQYGGCGVPGLKIIIPYDFLLFEREAPKEKLIAKEWMKYRYGVFDESGFRQDDRYPLYYRVPGSEDVLVTDCTNVPIPYQYRNSNGNNCTLPVDDDSGLPVEDRDCEIYADEGSKENIRSSLMYHLEGLDKNEHVCGHDSYDHRDISPNKQNALCMGKSIWEVVSSSTDLRDLESPEEAPLVEFAFFRESNPRIVFAWQITTDLEGKAILEGIEKLLYELPDEAEAAFLQFSKNAEQVAVLQKLGPNRRKMETAISKSLFNRDNSTVCTECAIQKALEILLQDNAQEKGTLMIITSSKPERDENLIAALSESQLCVSIVAFQEDGVTETEDYMAYVSASRCGKLWTISKTDEASVTYGTLAEALESLLPQPDTNVRNSTVQITYIKHGLDTEISLGDSSTASVTLWMMGRIQDTLVSCSKQPLATSSDMENLALTYERGNDNTMHCSLKHLHAPVLTQVRATSKPGEFFEGRAWVEYPSNSSTVQMPVIIYAKINFELKLVLNAEVKAIISTPGGYVEELELYDNGLGDPDITRDDGIYSRYFTQFTKEGEYKVVILVTDNKGQAVIGNEGSPKCCGSRVLFGSTYSAGSFQRTIQTSFKAIGGKPAEGYKPSRIVDLRVTSVNLPESVTLKWTAPGAEADTGRVTKYVIKSFNSKEDASNNFETAADSTTFEVDINPKDYGVEETTEIQFNDSIRDDKVHFLAMKAQVGIKSGDVSNVIEVFIPKMESTPSPPVTGGDESSETPDKLQGGVDKKTVGTIIGVIVAILLLVICGYAIVYFLIIKPKRENEKETAPREERSERNMENENGIALSPVDSIPAEVLMYHHKKVEDAKMQHKEPPIFRVEQLGAQEHSGDNVNNNLASTQGDKADMHELSPRNGHDDEPVNKNKKTTLI